jgi:hypothetical protein
VVLEFAITVKENTIAETVEVLHFVNMANENVNA